MTPRSTHRELRRRIADRTTLAGQVKVFARIERGSVNRHRADPAVVREVEQAVEQLLAVFYTPLDGRPFVLPRDA
jgi:hypothetical protein